jgi:ABC-2 type transport system ATP-binding protein
MGDQTVPAIQVEELTKRFGDVLAVDRASFEVRQGELFGFLGPNGAGKTTTLNMLTGLARPSGGAIRVCGRDYTRDLKKAQHLMGIVPDESNLYPELDGLENLRFCGALYGMRRTERDARARELLALVGLDGVAGRRFGQYSKGMKRKLTIAAGLMHRPQLLFLDEPTTGIDVASARQVRQLLAGLNAAGTTIFLTTHYIEEAERLCQRIAFIVAGRIVKIDTVPNLMQEFQGKHTIQFSLEGAHPDLRARLQEAFPDMECEWVSGSIVRVHSPRRIQLAPFLRAFEAHRIEVTEARKIQPSLEEVFVRVTRIEADVMRKEKGGPGQ